MVGRGEYNIWWWQPTPTWLRWLGFPAWRRMVGDGLYYEYSRKP